MGVHTVFFRFKHAEVSSDTRNFARCVLYFNYFPSCGKRRLTIVANCVRGSALGLQKFKQHLQIEFNVGKAVPGRRKCSKFFIPRLTANAVALSEAMHMAYDINSIGLPF